MTLTVRPVGLLLIITTLLMLSLVPRPSLANHDMWGDVFSYQKKMADYGNPEAQVKLGEMYEEGHGTEQDYDMAQQWYQKAADQGYAPATEKLNRLEARRKHEAEAEKARISREKAEQARRKREAAEQARLEQERKAAEQAKRERAERAAREKAEQERLAKEQAEKEAAEQARKAEEERLARERAKQAIKEMMSVPSAYSEE